MEETANAQVKATEEQAKANKNTEQGQRQDRLKNAIEHLGHEKDSVRLGGAYELFHLAEDTEDLRQTVLDILCSHIRRTTGEREYREAHKSEPSEEVQSLLTLLFVQEHEVFKGLHINLQGSWLNGASLQGARLEEAILTKVHLQGAHLQRALLQRAFLTEVHLQGAFLIETRLQGAYLQKALLQGAFLIETRLQEAHLVGAHLQGADLVGTYLQGAFIEGAHLQGTDLHETYLQGANLVGAHLQGADLYQAHLQGAYLIETRLQGAILTKTRLQGAILLGTDLRGAKSQVCPSSTFSQRMRFSRRMRESIGQESDLSGSTFEGGLSQKDLCSLVEGLSDEIAEELRETLEPHVGKPLSHQLPQDSDVTIGSYTEEDAEQWIAEYEQAMSEVPEDDS